MQKKNLSQIELAYLAGYFDGEGSVSFTKKLGGLSVRVGTADIEVIRLFYAAFGGKLYPWKTGSVNRQIWTWHVGNTKAQEVLLTLLPYLKAKRDVALAALLPTFGKGGTHLTEEERVIRLNTVAELKAINQRVEYCLS